MNIAFIVIVPLSLIACGSSAPQQESLVPRNVSVQEHLSESERHQHEADVHEEHMVESTDNKTTKLQCFDDPLETVSYSGTEPYSVMRPCWNGSTSPNAWHLQEEKRHLKEAAEHRAKADALVAAEGIACANLGKAEVSQSPLTRGRDILSIKPIYKHDKLQGTSIVLRKVSGLSVRWLEQSLACHRARAAALGYPAKFMSNCPMSLPGVTANVTEEDQGIVVTLQASRDEIAAAILSRMQATQAQAGN